MSESLVVVSRLGALGQEPYGLYDELADHLDADQFVPAEEHKIMFNDADRDNRYKVASVDARMLDRTADSLARGKSVVFDAYVNKPQKQRAIIELCREA